MCNEEKAKLPTVYDPGQVEERWYKAWREAGYFRGPEIKAVSYTHLDVYKRQPLMR